MLLRHLRYFAAVADESNVARAARKLRVAQPAVSRQIRALEDAVGMPLFARERRGVRLTAAGETLRAGVRRVFERIEQAYTRTVLVHEGMLGTIRIGLGRAALQSPRIGQALSEIRERFPDVNLVVREIQSFSQMDALRAGEIDLAVGIMGATQENGGSRQVLFADVVDRALLPERHRLARAKGIEPRQLRSDRLLLMNAALVPGFEGLYDNLKRLGFSEWEEHERLETVYGYVAAGRGWTTHLASIAAPRGTVSVPLTGLRVPLNMVARWNEMDTSRLTANVVAVLRNALRGVAGKRREAPRVERHERQTSKAPRDLELRQLRSFLATLEERSVSAAAPRLGLTQSGLSRQLRALERTFGFPLLQRTAQGVSATAAGEAFREEAAAIATLLEEVLNETRQVQRGIAGRCRIGAMPAELSSDLLVGALKEVSQRFPEIAVEVKEMLSENQVPALLAGEIDVGLAGAHPGLVDDAAIASAPLAEDVLSCALVAPSHPIAARSSVRAVELASEPFFFIGRETSQHLYERVMQAFNELGLVPLIGGTVDGPRAAWRLAADGMGWTLGARSQRADPPAGLVAVPIDRVRIPFGVQLLWRKDEENSAALTVLDAFRKARAS